jgi:hypothetical protein
MVEFRAPNPSDSLYTDMDLRILDKFFKDHGIQKIYDFLKSSVELFLLSGNALIKLEF